MSYRTQDLNIVDGVKSSVKYMVKNVYAKAGSHLYKGRRICEITCENNLSITVKAKFGGVVSKTSIKVGDNVSLGDSLIEVKACLHPTILGNMCCDCGVVLEERTQQSEKSGNENLVSMLHSIPDLKVSKEEAARVGSEDIKHLLDKRKLVLLVDLDQTLIHTTNDNIPPKLKDVFHFQLIHNGPWYHTRLRPYTGRFLKNVSKFYELHICTFGVREYAHSIAKFLDPDRKLFGDRILSRNECLDPMSKKANLSSLFPCGDNLVCIIDDRSDVWNFAPNVVQVMPYHFFQHTGDINAPPELQKKENDNISIGYDFSNLEELTSTKEERKKKSKNTKKSDKKDQIDYEDAEEACKDITNDHIAQKKIDIDSEEACNDKANDQSIAQKKIDIDPEEACDDKTNDQSIPQKIDIDPEEVCDDKTNDQSIAQKKIDIDHEEACNDKTNDQSIAQKKMDIDPEEACNDKTNDQSIAQKKMDIDPEEACNDKTNDQSIAQKKMDIDPEEVCNDKTNDQSNVQEETEKDAEKECKDKTDDLSNVQKKLEKDQSSSDVEAIINPEDKTSDDVKIEATDEHKTEETDIGDDGMKSTDSETIDVEDNDDYLLYLEDILTTLHKKFYEMYDYGSYKKDNILPDLKDIVPNIRKTVLDGCHLVLSGIIPQNTNLTNSKAYHIASSLGSTVSEKIILNPKDDYDHSVTTHVIAANLHTEKVHQAKKQKNIKIVTPNWLWCCAERWEHVDERLFELTEESEKTIIRSPPMHCFINLKKFSSADLILPSESVCREDITTSAINVRDDNIFESLNPLVYMSNDETKSMEDEVDNLLESEGEEEEKESQEFPNEERESSSSESEENSCHENRNRRTFNDIEDDADDDDYDDNSSRKRKRKRNLEDDDDDDDDDEDEDDEELPSIRFRQGGSLPSDDSDGDSCDDDMNTYGDILERELMRE